MGVVGLVLVALFLTFADFSQRADAAMYILLAMLCSCGMTLSVLSLVRERTKLFGYVGFIGAFLYLVATLTSEVVSAIGPMI